jgi:hypothetical protein
MSMADTISSMKNADLTVQRKGRGVFDSHGKWQPGSIVATFSVEASVQPATGMQRVVGGREMRGDEQGQHVADVRQLFTPTQLYTRDAQATPPVEPDQIVNYLGGTWTVTRVEEWTGPDGPEDLYYRVMVTKETRGAS